MDEATDNFRPVIGNDSEIETGAKVYPRAYAALGDSFTAGTGCAPGEGFADRLTARLRRGRPTLRYRNLAVDGARSGAVVEQLDAAVELEPDAVTIVCGANDVLFSVRPDLHAYGEALDTIFGRLRSTSPQARIATATAPESWRFLDLRPRTRERLARGLSALNPVTRSVAAAHRVACLELADRPATADPATFLEDGLHPSRRAHAYLAAAFEGLLTTGVSDPGAPVPR